MIETAIGWLSKENVIYLNGQGVLVRGGDDSIGIAHNERILARRRLQVYSMFCWVKDDVKALFGYNDINEIVDTMRLGFENRYPVVDSILKYGFRLFLLRQEQKKQEKDSYEGIDPLKDF
jgi:hypothetical protein